MTIEEREGLPDGWIETTLGDAGEAIRGITFPANAKEFEFNETNVACLRTSSVQKSVRWSDVYFVSKSFVKREDQIVMTEDILMSMANSYELVGKVARVTETPYPAAFGAFLAAIRPSEISSSAFLFNFLRTDDVQQKLREGSSQTTNIANISIARLSEIPLPLPPLAEQIRIADKLDALLSRVDAGRERLERVPKLVKRFRQSLLSAAVSGELTREWREGQKAE